jgi:hypothetical protein
MQVFKFEIEFRLIRNRNANRSYSNYSKPENIHEKQHLQSLNGSEGFKTH